MKRALIISGIVALTALAFMPGEDHPTLAIGAEAPLVDRDMKNTKGKDVRLMDVMGENGLLVIFSCNTCPFVVGRPEKGSEGWEGRYNEIFQVAAENQIGGILINSNEAKRSKGDSMDDMKKQAKERGYKVNYVLDQDHVLADAFGARTTPHVFLFDSNYKLVYKGAIDDNNDAASSVKEPWLKNALNDLSEGQTIEPNSTKAIGCSIKRVSK